MGSAATLGDADGEATEFKVKLVDWSELPVEALAATTRVDCVKNENSGLILCEGSFVLVPAEVVGVP